MPAWLRPIFISPAKHRAARWSSSRDRRHMVRMTRASSHSPAAWCDRGSSSIPEIANTRALRVSAADGAIIADAIEELARRFAGSADRSVGLVAISFGAGPALLAAGETPSGRRVRFVVTIGGYYDIDAAIGFSTTGTYRAPDGSYVRAVPNEYGAFVFLGGNAGLVRDPSDRALLTAIADRRLADPAADLADLVARLGPEGHSVYNLVANRNPLLVPALIAQLPEAIRAELRLLDLKGRAFPFLSNPVFVVHGEDDTMIPAGESAKLAASLGARAELYTVERFAHVDVGTATIGDSLRLWNAAIRILRSATAGECAPINRALCGRGGPSSSQILAWRNIRQERLRACDAPACRGACRLCREPHLPALTIQILVLDLHRHNGANAGEGRSDRHGGRASGCHRPSRHACSRSTRSAPQTSEYVTMRATCPAAS